VASGSVRTRAAAGATLVVAVALVAAGIAVVTVLGRGLTHTAQLQAEASAREVAAQVRDVDADRVGGVDGLDEDEPAQVVDGQREVLGASESLRGRGPIAHFGLVDDERGDHDERGDADDAHDRGDADDDRGDAGDGRGDAAGEAEETGEHSDAGEGERYGVGAAGDDASEAESRTLSLPSGDDGGEKRDFQVVAVQSRTLDGRPVTVYAGSSLSDQREAVSSVTETMLIGLPLLLVVVAGVTWLVTRRALRPVEGIRGEMAAITASTDLTRRVPEPAARDEVARLARTTNETLAALEAAVERQRRFVADASHELRNPIASLRTQLEVGEAHPELLDVGGAVQDTVRLQRLAGDLLLLARLDAGERPGEARVALDALVREELAQRTGDPHPVRTPELAEGEVLGSRGQLARVLGNLLDNAQRHARTSVTVAVRRGGADLVVEVEDDGAGVPEAERERIFERFVRLDDARSRDEGGAGLGLAIARDVARRHGGTLTAPRGARFELRLPAA
jgi:signal transduction histidine kinase